VHITRKTSFSLSTLLFLPLPPDLMLKSRDSVQFTTRPSLFAAGPQKLPVSQNVAPSLRRSFGVRFKNEPIRSGFRPAEDGDLVQAIRNLEGDLHRHVLVRSVSSSLRLMSGWPRKVLRCFSGLGLRLLVCRRQATVDIPDRGPEVREDCQSL